MKCAPEGLRSPLHKVRVVAHRMYDWKAKPRAVMPVSLRLWFALALTALAASAPGLPYEQEADVSTAACLDAVAQGVLMEDSMPSNALALLQKNGKKLADGRSPGAALQLPESTAGEDAPAVVARSQEASKLPDGQTNAPGQQTEAGQGGATTGFGLHFGQERLHRAMAALLSGGSSRLARAIESSESGLVLGGAVMMAFLIAACIILSISCQDTTYSRGNPGPLPQLPSMPRPPPATTVPRPVVNVEQYAAASGDETYPVGGRPDRLPPRGTRKQIPVCC